jgi:hypothetical protein
VRDRSVGCIADRAKRCALHVGRDGRGMKGTVGASDFARGLLSCLRGRDDPRECLVDLIVTLRDDAPVD